MDLTKLTAGERVVLAAGVVLLIDLLFLPWYHVDLGVLGSVSRSAVQSPYAGYGFLALIVTFVMVAQIVAAKLLSAQLPDPPLPWSQVHFIAGAVVLALLLLKIIAETTALGFGAYLAVLLGVGLLFGGYTIKQEAGGLA
jgi:hypothetical protein